MREHEHFVANLNFDERADPYFVDASNADETIGAAAHGGWWSLEEIGGGGGDRTHDLAVMSRSL